jgi:hypothetical protein
MYITKIQIYYFIHVLQLLTRHLYEVESETSPIYSLHRFTSSLVFKIISLSIRLVIVGLLQTLYFMLAYIPQGNKIIQFEFRYPQNVHRTKFVVTYQIIEYVLSNQICYYCCSMVRPYY